ncbi:sucrose-6-phosphate hydrolase [Weissella paramesenteroides]|uniref:sucrose-6-phosphate hydrolase n=1 Tax=Weissella paramesenteroides TaxID=1249 RepID=UPI001040D052|nr:sucrose-6-phosphate hydrolase [Weissella paramesenteroides]RZQ58087.1 sucrose-6-phosphate hydrolase [Weissella paramesenteroides]
MTWTREKRYQPYGAYSEIIKQNLEKKVATSIYKPGFHISPTSGLLNDPNGFSYYNGRWHVFYQAFPFGAVHGLKSWVHCISDDLVHWHNLGIALQPGDQFDSHGAYSGSAQVIDDQLFLMYTGNVRNNDWHRSSFQLGAWMNKHNEITKINAPLITAPKHVTDHFRDPQLLKINDTYYALIGAQDKQNLRGEFSLYQSDNLKDWQDMGYVQHELGDLGYMIECPNLVYVDGKAVLIFCPQGISQDDLPADNIYPNVYTIGSDLDFDTGEWHAKQQTIVQLDDGFDVYASQAFNAPDGNVYVISWVGLPEIDYPTDREDWAHCLSLVKQLKVVNNKLYQLPVPAMSTLVVAEQILLENQQQLVAHAGQQYELKLNLAADQTGNLLLVSDGTEAHSLQLKFDTNEAGYLIVDRSNVGEKFAIAYGETREIALNTHQALNLDIFIDHSVCEIFVNGGEKVMTLRFFAPQQQTMIAFAGQNTIEYSGSYLSLSNM